MDLDYRFWFSFSLTIPSTVDEKENFQPGWWVLDNVFILTPPFVKVPTFSIRVNTYIYSGRGCSKLNSDMKACNANSVCLQIDVWMV